MREFKFRVWDKDKNKMMPVLSFDEYEIVVADKYEVNWRSRIDSFSRDNGIVMQYTGLKDKNGKEIYEGDIVEMTVYIPDGYDPIRDAEIHHDERLKYKVEIGEVLKTFLIPVSDKDDPFGAKDMFWYIDETDEDHEIEIIGNIYENPELLED